MSTALIENPAASFLNRGGEMGKLILNYNWSQTSIKAIDQWPQSLKITLSNLLSSAFPMFLFWGDDLVCFYNDAFKPSLGKDGKHPAIGKKGEEVWADIWDFIGPLVSEVRTKGKTVYFEDELMPFFCNGAMEDIYWTFSYSPVFENDGSINGVLVTCIETTAAVLSRKKVDDLVEKRTAELNKAHKDLQASNVYLQQIINLFKEPLQVLEPVFENGNIVDFCFKLTNDAYAAYTGTSPEKLINKRVSEVFPGYLQTTSFTNVVNTFSTGKCDTWEIHYTLDGLDLYNEMSATKSDGQVVVHFTDFTKLKNLQLQLEGKIVELERSNRNLEEFANAASHDLKEPVRKISFFTSHLKSQLVDHIQENQLRLFEKIENATQRMNLLINDLLLYSHVSQQPHDEENVDLNRKVALVLEDLELDIIESKAIINVGQLPVVQGNKRQLQQMFQNLLSNALKYKKENDIPRINIEASTVLYNDKHYHLIQVKDNGIGFDQKYGESIFKMFTRLHGRQDYPGTGVGLSIVRKVIEDHNGIIRAEGVPGKGSIFNIYLPVKNSSDKYPQ